MLVTDAQIHLWELERPDRPWPKDGRATPQRPDGFTAEQMLAEMDPVGVDRAVIVPPSWIGESNEYALEAAEKYPNRFAVMGHSGGGPHALACGALLPDRVVAVVVGAGLAPYGADGLDWFAGMVPAGVASLRAAVAGRAAKEAHQAIAYVPGNVALLVHTRGASEEEAVEYAMKWGLRSRERAEQSVRFVTDPVWRSYVSTYTAGHDLCRAFVNGDPSRFKRLLTEQLTPAELAG